MLETELEIDQSEHPLNATMANAPPSDLAAEVDFLRKEVARLQQANSDLEISLVTIAQHGDTITADLELANQRLQQEIHQRQLAQTTLQTILETVTQDKADLELMLKATAEHGDMLEYQLYTQAVETMRHSEALFRAISESTPVLMILMQRLDGEISYANSTSMKGLGVGVQDLVGHKLTDFLASSEEAERLQTILHQQGYVHNCELQARHADGSLFWVSASVHPLTLGGSQSLLTTLFDISDRKQVEDGYKQATIALQDSEAKLREQAQELERRVEQRTAQLQTAEAKYRSIFENAAEGIFQISPEGRYLDVNPALAELYGYESPEAFIASVTDINRQIYVRPRRWGELLAYMKAMGSISGSESEVYRRDGSIIWVSENIRVIYDPTGAVMCYEGSVWNVSDRRAAEAELLQQRQRSELLLLSVLPQPIAERLKRGETHIADSFAEATVLFADIADFTQLSTRNSPIEIIALLNQVFSTFDQLADKHRLEKIKTIGDAYMVVAGVPTAMPGHVSAMADMALDMKQAMHQFQTKDGQPISLRIGLHTGPVVAGVIGNRKFIYDLWGDTVNIASRMESQGEIGRIQVTARVYERLHKRYNLEERGSVHIKGKGKMLTYWLENRKNSGF
jgi:PAS domain S-box-containing protein